ASVESRKRPQAPTHEGQHHLAEFEIRMRRLLMFHPFCHHGAATATTNGSRMSPMEQICRESPEMGFGSLGSGGPRGDAIWDWRIWLKSQSPPGVIRRWSRASEPLGNGAEQFVVDNISMRARCSKKKIKTTSRKENYTRLRQTEREDLALLLRTTSMEVIATSFYLWIG
ncbi:hypothetical protein U9M48_000805, partial [Paspalum notatum var. saurae]